MHAVRRGAADVAEAVGGCVQAQGLVQGQGVGGAAGVALGRKHIDLAQALASFHQRGNAGRQVTVVVGNQDSHGRIVGGATIHYIVEPNTSHPAH